MATFVRRPLVAHDFGEFGQQGGAVARLLTRQADRRRHVARVEPPAEADDIPGGSASRGVEARDQRLVGERGDLTLLRGQDTPAVDEL